MAPIRIISTSLQCPNCNSFDGYDYRELFVTCKKCSKTYDVYDLFEQTLLTKHDSNLWSFPFTIISEYGLAKVFEGVLADENLIFRPFQQIEINLENAGLPENAKILYINFSPHTRDEKSLIHLQFAYIRGYDTLSISEISPVLRIMPIPLGKITEWAMDSSKYLNATILIRWHLKDDNDIVADHVIKAAEGYWENDLNKMVYNGFSAFELSLSNLIEDFWIKRNHLSEKEFKEFFDRSGVEKKIRVHIPLMCRELSVEYSPDVNKKFLMVDQLRQQRNSVVHDGQINKKYENEKGKLFAAFCWALLFLRELQAKLQ